MHCVHRAEKHPGSINALFLLWLKLWMVSCSKLIAYSV